ncbi:DUF3990 domain-containing protein [Nocardia sp. NPDC059240]|uniref:DUF3990 domain-containing protein n=1 Tax=Nocardia sp. NPDC059240 TaxID=3346786 RepID=UPI0036C2B1EC
MPEDIRPPGPRIRQDSLADPVGSSEGRVFNFTVRSAADAAAKFGRITAVQDLIDTVVAENCSAPSPFSVPAPAAPILRDVAGPAPIMPKMPDPKLPEKIDQRTNPAPANPAPQPAPQFEPQPQPQRSAPTAGQNPVGTGDPAPTLAELGLGSPGQPAPPPKGSADDLNAVLVGGPPAPGQTVALPSGNTTITTGADQTTIIGTADPVTGHNKTDVLDRNGLLIATAESDIVLDTGGLSRDTTITSIGGAVTQVRSVDDGYGRITTWTANPDGSHSVRYADGTVVKEPAPGSNTPAEIVQLDPDGLGGHVTEYNLDGTTIEADFRPGILNAPVTEITGPDGTTMQVVTVPGHTNGAPYSIITNPDLTRAVLQPDGTTIPIDRYNNMTGGPNYGNQFDPLTGTWRSDPVTARGPILTGPDDTSTQEWTYKNRNGEQRTATATFDKNNNLTGLQSGDYTGFDSSTFKTFDGITVPVWSGHADAGNVKDDSRLYWDAILTVSGLPELGYRAGLAIGARLIARELATKGMSEAGIQLATSTLITRGATTFTGLSGAGIRGYGTSLREGLTNVGQPTATNGIVKGVTGSAGQGLSSATTSLADRGLQTARNLKEQAVSWTATIGRTMSAAVRNAATNFGAPMPAAVGGYGQVPWQVFERSVQSGATRAVLQTEKASGSFTSLFASSQSGTGWNGLGQRLLSSLRRPKGAGDDDELISFFHGTTRRGAQNIRSEGIRIIPGNPGTKDFGPGFYTTRDLEEAINWAQIAANRSRGDIPEILQFEILARDFGQLNRRSLSNGPDWSRFIEYFRRAPDPSHEFDVVEGPRLSNLREFKRGQAPAGSGQQTSWHTEKALSLLWQGLKH